MATQFFTNPVFRAMEPAWIEFRDLFEGEHEVLTQPQYLWVHEFEQNTSLGGKEMRATREQRTRYVNFYASFVARFIAIIFKNGIDTSEIEEMFGDFIDDVDGMGTDFVGFIKTGIAQPYFNFGKPTILTDTFGVQSGSKLEEQAAGQRPFWDSISPLEIPDWEIQTSPGTEFGDLSMWRCIYKMVEPRESLSVEPKTREYTKVLFLKDGKYSVEIFRRPLTDDTQPETIRTDSKARVNANSRNRLNANSDWVLDGSTTTNLTELPVASISRTSWMKGVVPQALQLHNLQSTWDNVLLFQAYQRGFLSGRFNVEDGKPMVQNEYSFTILPADVQVTMVEPVNTAAIEKRYDVVLSNMFRTVFSQSRTMPSDSKGIASFQTIRETKEEFLTSARNAAQDIERVANEAIRHWALFMGIENFEGEIKLGRDLQIEDIDQFFQSNQMFQDRISRIPTWRKAVDKKGVTLMNLPEEEEIIEEIDNSPDLPDEPQTQGRFQEIINGRQANNPAPNAQTDQGTQENS